MRAWARWGFAVFTVLFLVIVIAFFPMFTDELDGVEGVPQFQALDIDYTHQYTKDTSPFLGSAVIDIDGDDSFEIFVGGGQGQADNLFSYDPQTQSFTNLIEPTGLSELDATYGVISLDVNQDDQVDLIITRHSGLYLYLNNNGVFTKQHIPLNLAADTFPVSAAPGDINNDGWVDLYISTFITADKFKSATYSDPDHGKPNLLLLNNGDNTFTDITESSGAGFHQNTFLSAFVDLNDDGLQDLVVSPNTDQVQIFENLGDNKFQAIPSPVGHGAWMGLAIDDYDSDGDVDIFVSNMGAFAPSALVRGDLLDHEVLDTDWALLENQGDFTFERVHRDAFDDREFAWGALFADLNNDALIDLLVAENYIKWPFHLIKKSPGRFFIQSENHQFLSVTKSSGLENYHFGQSPLAIDLNDDLALDIIYTNMHGPVRALLNTKHPQYNALSVELPDAVSSLGAKVVVTTPTQTQTKYYIPGTGFLTDHTPRLHFGLGSDDSAATVEVHWLSGETTLIEAVRGKIEVKRNEKE